MPKPELIKPIPTQAVNEYAAFGPVSFKDFFQGSDGTITFKAELSSGAALPQGLICTSDGVLTGIPAKNTQGNHEVVLTAESGGESIQTTFLLMIKPSPTSENDSNYLNKLKAQIWEALEHRLPAPDLGMLFERKITEGDIAYMLDRWGFITIWDAFNLDSLHDKKRLDLKGLNAHYVAYDRGPCLIACPKDLFSHERTIEDGLQAARILAQEAYKRNWTVELTGTAKLTRAAWVELQLLGEQHQKPIDIINYNPTPKEAEIYQREVARLGATPNLDKGFD